MGACWQIRKLAKHYASETLCLRSIMFYLWESGAIYLNCLLNKDTVVWHFDVAIQHCQ